MRMILTGAMLLLASASVSAQGYYVNWCYTLVPICQWQKSNDKRMDWCSAVKPQQDGYTNYGRRFKIVLQHSTVSSYCPPGSLFSYPANYPTSSVYACKLTNGDHFLSLQSTCGPGNRVYPYITGQVFSQTLPATPYDLPVYQCRNTSTNDTFEAIDPSVYCPGWSHIVTGPAGYVFR